nr:PrsW family glutamic-type intramembrane protease [Demequina litorisediminis]
MTTAEPPPTTVAIATLRRPLPRTATFVDVRSLVFWAGAAVTLYGLVTWLPLVAASLRIQPATGVLSGIVWLLYGCAFLLVLYRMELFERRSPMTVAGALAWGAFAAPGLAAVSAPAMHDLVAAVLPVDEAWISSFAAPLVEEPLKWLGIVALALIPGARLRSAADGLFYGAVVGLGFQVSESLHVLRRPRLRRHRRDGLGDAHPARRHRRPLEPPDLLGHVRRRRRLLLQRLRGTLAALGCPPRHPRPRHRGARLLQHPHRQRQRLRLLHHQGRPGAPAVPVGAALGSPARAPYLRRARRRRSAR